MCVYVCIQNVDETQRNKHAIWEMKFPECDSLVQCPKGNNEFSTVYWSGSEHWPKMLLLLWWTTRKNAETCSLLFNVFKTDRKNWHAYMLSCFSCVQLCVTLWTVAYQAPLSMGFSRQEHRSGLPWPPHRGSF